MNSRVAAGGVEQSAETGLQMECSVFGAVSTEPNSDLMTYAVNALTLQSNRGRETSGVGRVASDGTISTIHSKGLISYEDAAVLQDDDESVIVMSHGRYATLGSSDDVSEISHPIERDGFMVAFNGQTDNRELIAAFGEGIIGATDSITAANIIEVERREGEVFVDRLARVLPMFSGAYAMIAATPHALYGAVDPYGIRPLNLFKNDRNWALASESYVSTKMPGYGMHRAINPGEILRIDQATGDQYSLDTRVDEPEKFCGMEIVYFGMPASRIKGEQLYTTRERLGKAMAEQDRRNGFDFDRIDTVIGVPKSGLPFAVGYGLEANINQKEGFMVNDIGKTFIMPSTEGRGSKVKMKLTPLHDVINGKNLLVIDDSLVRGNTMYQLVQMLKTEGAKEIHIRSGFPPIVGKCIYGIDIADEKQLIAHKYAHLPHAEMVQAIAKELSINTLDYINEDTLRDVYGHGLCLACVDGDYPTAERILDISRMTK